MNGVSEKVFDVLVVGGGPAGSSTALRLARAGHRVGLLEARSLPRSKPCGDTVSPGAASLLRELGVWDQVRPGPAGGVRLEGWRIRAPDGTWVEARFGLSTEAPDEPALAIDRRTFDLALLEKAREAGVQVFERRRAFSRSRTSGSARWELGARDADGRVERFSARFIVGADGLRSRIARLLGPVRPGPRPRLAVVGRFRETPVDETWGQLRLSREGVLGFAPTGRGRCNVTCVFPSSKAPSTRPDAGAFLMDRLGRYDARSLVGRGTLDRPPEITGPFWITPHVRTAPGALLVGDAAGYYDPLTGQGVYRALLSARLAAEAVAACLSDASSAAEALARYESALDAALGPSRRLQRLIDGVVSRPFLMNPATRLLRRRPELTTRLIDATGDRLDPSSLLRPSPWLAALLGQSRPVGQPLEPDAYA